MKVEIFYDVCCDECLSHLSTDFNRGFASNSVQAKQWAKEVGFRDYKGKTLCRRCYSIYKMHNIKNKTEFADIYNYKYTPSYELRRVNENSNC